MCCDEKLRRRTDRVAVELNAMHFRELTSKNTKTPSDTLTVNQSLVSHDSSGAITTCLPCKRQWGGGLRKGGGVDGAKSWRD